MAPITLADTRMMTLEGAKQCLEQIAHAECRIASKAARYEKAIAKAKSRFESETAVDKADIKLRQDQLCDFILTHRELFKKPRAIRTEFGEFGLRKASNKLQVANVDAVIQWAQDNGYTDLYEVTKTLVIDAVKRLIAAEQEIPGCSVPKGDLAFYKIAKSLLEEASAIPEDAETAAAQ